MLSKNSHLFKALSGEEPYEFPLVPFACHLPPECVEYIQYLAEELRINPNAVVESMIISYFNFRCFSDEKFLNDFLSSLDES